MATKHIIILGAGFAGMGVATHLRHLLDEQDPYDIVLVDQNNYSLFTPMLTEVAGGDVDADEIVVAVRTLGSRVTLEQGRVTRIDPYSKAVTIEIGEGTPGVPLMERTIEAHHLVIAVGSVNNFHHIPGVAEHSLTLKSVDDAMAIRHRMLALLERADEEESSDVRRGLLTVVVAGGGFSGVETMAAVNDMLRGLVPHFSRLQSGDIRTIIAQPGDRLLPELSARLAAYTQRHLETRGVEIRLNMKVTGAGVDFVELQDSSNGRSERIPTHTLIWTGGVKPNPVIDSSGLPLGKHHGITVDSCCRVPHMSNVWALGDCAEVPKPDGKGTYAPTAQNATREGKQVAHNIVATIKGEAPKPFIYHPIGELALVGKRSGVASLRGIHLSGMIAWALWRMIYLAKLPGLRQRLKVSIDWLLDLIFGRDVATIVSPATNLRDERNASTDSSSKSREPKEAKSA